MPPSCGFISWERPWLLKMPFASMPLGSTYMFSPLRQLFMPIVDPDDSMLISFEYSATYACLNWSSLAIIIISWFKILAYKYSIYNRNVSVTLYSRRHSEKYSVLTFKAGFLTIICTRFRSFFSLDSKKLQSEFAHSFSGFRKNSGPRTMFL